MTGMLVVKQAALFHAAANWEHHVAQISLTRVRWYLDISYDSRWSTPATKLHPHEFTLCLLHKLQTLSTIQLTIIIRKNCNTVTSTLGFCLVLWYTVTCSCSSRTSCHNKVNSFIIITVVTRGDLSAAGDELFTDQMHLRVTQPIHCCYCYYCYTTNTNTANAVSKY